jgi:glycosyltransferase involved in cell wall biosynthesis
VPLVVANGRLSVAKNIPLLLRAHQRVLAAGLHHRLLVMGEGPERPVIEATIEDLQVTDSVTLAGFVAEPYGTIAAADLFVLSSDTEGLPLTLIEAMAVGAPIVSTRCGSGPGLLLDEGRYGELVPVGSIGTLATAIETHLRDPRPLRERAALGPARALQFDAGRAADALLAVLSDLSRPTTPVTTPVTTPARG